MAIKRRKTIGRKAELENLRVLASTLVGRAALQARMGKSYGDDRDLYHIMGYSKNPQFDDYYQRYLRQDIAKTIVDAPVKATWAKKLFVEEDKKKGEDSTEFEKAWSSLVKDNKLKLIHNIQRADKLAGVGEYAVLFLGFDDGKTPDEPCERASSLVYVHPYAQNNAEIIDYEREITSPRFGLPTFYHLKFGENISATGSYGVMKVHWSRVLHVSEGLLEDNVFGTPRLRPVLNRLQDLELVSASSAEMFFRGAFPGYGLSAREGATFTEQSLSDLEDELEEYIHGMKRYIRLQGMDVKELAQQVATPKGHVEVLLWLISAGCRIPRRILTGSERGELSSKQDDQNWSKRVVERREDYAEPIILRPLIERLVDVGAMVEPKGDFDFTWPDLFAPSDKEVADTAKVMTDCIAAYANAQGADLIMPIEMFLIDILKVDKDKVEQITKMIEEIEREEEKEIEEDEERIEEEERQQQQKNMIDEEDEKKAA